jgi:hypothetical protein
VELALPLPIRGLIIGFTIAAAVGPISLLVIRRTIEHGGIYGFASGLGVATADATYGAIAAFGLTAPPRRIRLDLRADDDQPDDDPVVRRGVRGEDRLGIRTRRLLASTRTSPSPRGGPCP